MAPDGQPDPYDVHPDRAPLLRSTVLAWQASVVLLLLSALFVLVWVWITARTQQHLSSGGYSFGDAGSHPTIVDRIDAATGTVSFLSYAAVTLALGLGLRMAADVAANRLRLQQVVDPDTTLGPDTP
jgi:hypothetical protein